MTGGGTLGKVQLAEVLLVFMLFLAMGLTWAGVMPMWQGPDEPAHFAYVQYMGDHVVPPVEKIVASGRQSWLFSPSPAEVVAIRVTERNRVLASPGRWLSVTPREAATARETVAAASAAPGGDVAGSQNYVGIYPPLYYGIVGRLESWFGVKNVFAQVFGGRLASAVLLGLTGIFMDLMLGLMIPAARRRVALAAALGLLFPTLGMLGGSVTNDLAADAASMAVFYMTLRTLAAGRFRAVTAVWLGAAAGLAIWTKEEAYLGLGVSVPFVVWRVWRLEGVRRGARWLAAAAATALVIGGPWLLFTWHAYHALIPPLTYQGAGGEPRSVAWVLSHQLLNWPYVKNLLVTQTVFGVNYPWWYPWPHHQWAFSVVGLVLGAMLAAGLLWAPKGAGFWLALAWIAVGSAALGVLQIRYALETGISFLQGRYFFFLLGPFIWFAGHALKRLPRLGIPLLLAGAALLFGLVVNATLYRYYHAGLWPYITGRTVVFGPPSILLLSRAAAVALALASVGLIVAAVALRPASAARAGPGR